MYQNDVKVPIGDCAAKRFKSMSENDFVRHVSKNNLIWQEMFLIG
jgi:hypothetical protein